MKALLLSILDDINARRYLAGLSDRRYLHLNIGKVLKKSALYWPVALPRKFKPKTIIDIGAHKGSVAKELSILYRPDLMILFEPIPALAAQLKLIQFADRQMVYCCALGRSECNVAINILENISSSSILLVTVQSSALFNTSFDIVDTIEVPMRTLDSFADEWELTCVDLLKIDVQGYELEVISGGINLIKKTKYVIIESSFFKHYENQPLFEDIYHEFTGLGFKLINTVGFTFDNNGNPLQCDAVFKNMAC